MKRKTIIAILSLLITFSVIACGENDSTEMIVTEDKVETETTEIVKETDTEKEKLPWIELASLETHPELRTALESYYEVTVDENGEKHGPIYTDETGKINQNNVIFYAAGNFKFIFGDYTMTVDYWDDAVQAVHKEYTDLEEEQEEAAIYNDYFELLPDIKMSDKFNGNSSLTRAQAMTLVMRATTPVNEAQAPDEDKDFTSSVGKSVYTDFAAPMNEYAYINTSNGLNETTFNEPMTRGEYIYLLENALFINDYSKRITNCSEEDKRPLRDDIEITTIYDAGDITYQDALNNKDGGLPTEIYSMIVMAINTQLITEDTLAWNEELTKADAIDLIMQAASSMNVFYEFCTYRSGKIITTTNPENASIDLLIHLDCEYLDDLAADYKGDWPTKLEAYVKDQGADAYNGAWLIYYYGSAAGDQRSYAINQRTGEKMVAGPDSFFYGTSLNDDGAEPFWGTDKTYPGDKYPEFEQNMRLATGFDVD